MSEIEQLVTEWLYARGVIREGHFALRSGDHSGHYVNKRQIPEAALSLIGRGLMSLTHDQLYVRIVAPEHGAIPLAHVLAELRTDQDPLFPVEVIVARKDGAGGFFIEPRDAEHLNGCAVLALEDIITTGSSIAKVVSLIRRHGGIVVGAVCLWNRGEITAQDIGDVGFFDSLVKLTFPTWSAHDCPLCARGIPLDETPGHDVPETS